MSPRRDDSPPDNPPTKPKVWGEFRRRRRRVTAQEIVHLSTEPRPERMSVRPVDPAPKAPPAAMRLITRRLVHRVRRGGERRPGHRAARRASTRAGPDDDDEPEPESGGAGLRAGSGQLEQDGKPDPGAIPPGERARRPTEPTRPPRRVGP